MILNAEFQTGALTSNVLDWIRRGVANDVDKVVLMGNILSKQRVLLNSQFFDCKCLIANMELAVITIFYYNYIFTCLYKFFDGMHQKDHEKHACSDRYLSRISFS